MTEEIKYQILIVAPELHFEGERTLKNYPLKNDTILFVNYWSTDPTEWFIVQCLSKEDRDKLLKIMNNEEGKKQQYILGFKQSKFIPERGSFIYNSYGKEKTNA